MDRGLFIALEGIDGAGTTTQAELLEKWLKSKGYKVHLTREPTTWIIGGIIRAVLTDDLKLSDKVLTMLFAADRLHHVEKEIIPLLQKGVFIVCDRYFLSNLAYHWNEYPKEWLIELERFAILPDVTFLLDIPAEVSLERIGKSRFEVTLYEKLDKLRKVRENYLELAKVYPNIVIIDGTKSIEEVHKEITQKLQEMFNL